MQGGFDEYNVHYCLGDLSGTSEDKLIIQRWGVSYVTSVDTLVPVTDGTVTYTMSVSASYATPGDPDSDLTLAASLTDNIGTVLTADLMDTTPLAGTGFGLYLYAKSFNGHSTITADFDNIAITPEPATLGLLAIGGAALLRRKRRALHLRQAPWAAAPPVASRAHKSIPSLGVRPIWPLSSSAAPGYGDCQRRRYARECPPFSKGRMSLSSQQGRAC